MALDGIYLRFLKNEIEKKALQSKVDKIYQPQSDEIVFSLRCKGENLKLVINCGSNCQRVALTAEKAEAPKVPPMFCMLLRKHLTGGTLVSVRQEGLDRILYFDFSVISEIGEREQKTIVAHLTGRSGNVILIKENGKIIDAVRRTDLTGENTATVLPSALYLPPKGRDKCDISICSAQEASDRIFRFSDTAKDVLLREIEGISPQTAAELAERVFGDSDAKITPSFKDKFENEIDKIKQTISGERDGEFFINFSKDNKPTVFGFLAPLITGNKFFESPSEAIELFYRERAQKMRASVYTYALTKLVTTRKERLKRKLALQREDLKKAAEREKYRITGELITANLYKIKKGDRSVDVENYYEDPPALLKIPLDVRLTPSGNAQKYYKEYNKLLNAEKMLLKLIEKGEEEEEYLESVLYSLKEALSETDALRIKEELINEGYIRENKKIKKKLPEGEFKKAITTDGFEVLIGRNNLQNDKLTLKTAEAYDMWLHAKDVPGSHVIIRAADKEITERAILEAAEIAAANSKAKEAGKVAVDYTLKRYVKKPSGSPPGKVIYTNQKTVYVTPKGENK